MTATRPPSGKARLRHAKAEALRKALTARVGAPVEAEHRFAPPRFWRFDFAVVSHRVALELEGGVWVGGRHTRGSGFVADLEKYSVAASLGWLIVRVQPDAVLAPQTITWLKAAMAAR